MQLYRRLEAIGFEVATLQSSDLRLWSDRQRILYFFVRKLCGENEQQIQVATTQIRPFQQTSEDDVTSTAKGFCHLFSQLGLDHVTLENILGTCPQCNTFVESTVEIIEIMTENDAGGKESGDQRADALPTGLDGFMSNVALFDAACCKIKDLLKTDMDLFPANLKQEAASFRDNVENHLHCVFEEVLSLKDQFKAQFQKMKLSPANAKDVLQHLRPSSLNEAVHQDALQQLSDTFHHFNDEIHKFVQTFPTCVKTEPTSLQGIGPLARSILHSYRQLMHLMELMKCIHETKGAVTLHTHVNALADVKHTLHCLQQQTEPFLRHKGRQKP